MPVPFVISSVSEPVLAPGLTLTVQVVPLPVMLVTVAPVPPLKPKLAAVTPVTASLKVTVQESVDAPEGLGPTRLIETTFGAIV